MWWSETAARLLAALLAATLAGCGFQLRGEQKLPFETIFVNTPPNSPLGATLSRQIRTGTTTRTVEQASEATAVLDILGEARDREILTLNAQGRAVEYKLIYRLRFRLHDGKGREYIAATEMQAQRDISINDSQVLAKESEESLLYRDMQTDLVQQLLRRIAAVRPHADQG
ncbi:MAG TPA: LPS assembly lipoprotein LptE [Burkholderiaceae bacterium]|jgi:LPS-assembly lipoprotein|nr:LPS assembly lipoprotein LptE [Burkholderiaceae bacterium]